MLFTVTLLCREHLPAPCIRVVVERRGLHGNNADRFHVTRVKLPQFLLGAFLRAAGIQPVSHDRRLVCVHLHHLASRIVDQFKFADDPAIVVAIFARHEPVPELARIVRHAADLLTQTVGTLDLHSLEGRFCKQFDTQGEKVGLCGESELLVFVQGKGTLQKAAPCCRSRHLPGLGRGKDRFVADRVLLVVSDVGIVDQ